MKLFCIMLMILFLGVSGCRKKGSEQPRAVVPQAEVLTEPEKDQLYIAGERAFGEKNYRLARQYFYSIWNNDKEYRNVSELFFDSTSGLGQGLVKSGKIREALDYLREANSLRPASTEARTALISALTHLSENEKNTDKKMEYLEEAYQVSKTPELAVSIFDLYLKNGKLQQGIELLEKHLAESYDLKVMTLLIENLMDTDVLKAFEIYQNNQKNFNENDSEIVRIDRELQSRVKNNYAGMAQVEKNRKNWEGMIFYLEKAREMGQENARILTDLGMAQLQSGNVEKSLIVLTKALEYDSQNLETLKLLRSVYQQKKELQKQLMVQKKIVSIMPQDLDEQFLLVELLARNEEYKEAMMYVNEILSKNPAYAPALEKKAFLLFQGGDFAQAKEIWNRIYDQDRNNSETNFYLGICAYKERNFPSARDYLKKAIQINPSESKYYYYYLLVLKDQGNYPEMEQLKKQIADRELTGNFVTYLQKMFNIGKSTEPKELSFDEPENHYTLGLAQARKGDYQDALASFEKALEDSPENSDVLINIGNIHYMQKNYQQSLVSYFKALKSTKNNFFTNYFIARSLNRLGLNKQAEEFYRICRSVASDNREELEELGKELEKKSYTKTHDAEEKLAHLLLQNQLLTEARMFFEEASMSNGDKSGSYFNLGNLALMEGKNKEAAVFLQKAVEINPSHLEAYISLGRIYLSESREKALEYYLKAYNLDKTNPEVIENIASLYLKTRDYGNARDFYTRLKGVISSQSKIEQINNILKTIP